MTQQRLNHCILCGHTREAHIREQKRDRRIREKKNNVKREGKERLVYVYVPCHYIRDC